MRSAGRSSGIYHWGERFFTLFCSNLQNMYVIEEQVEKMEESATKFNKTKRSNGRLQSWDVKMEKPGEAQSESTELCRWPAREHRRGSESTPQTLRSTLNFWIFHSSSSICWQFAKNCLHMSAQKFVSNCQHFNFRLKGQEDNDCRIEMLPDGDQSSKWLLIHAGHQRSGAVVSLCLNYVIIWLFLASVNPIL